MPLAGGLDEAAQLLDAAHHLLTFIEDKEDRADIRGSLFLIGAAAAVIASLQRGFAEHPLAQGADGYHA